MTTQKTDGLASKLLARAAWYDKAGAGGDAETTAALLREAADEIERLMRSRDYWKERAEAAEEKLATMLRPYTKIQVDDP